MTFTIPTSMVGIVVGKECVRLLALLSLLQNCLILSPCCKIVTFCPQNLQRSRAAAAKV